MNTIHVFFSVLALLFLVAFSTSNAYATYEETGFRLVHNPMICTFEPYPNQLIPNLGMDLRTMTENAISDWKYNLNSDRDASWNIVLNEVSYDKVATFNSAKCDIGIFYLPSPTTSPDSEEPVGVTTYDFAHNRAKIVIYYFKMTWDLQTTETRDSNYIYYHYTPVFSYVTNQIATESQIGTTLRHELGHAFGLGHYAISKQETDSLIRGNEGNVPSIMVPIVIPYGRNSYSITPSDVQQLKSLYGKNGFSQPIQSAIQSPDSVPQSSTLQSPEEPVTNDPKYSYARNPLLSDIKNGYISEFNFGISFYAFKDDGLVNVQMPDKSNGSTTYPHWFNSVITLWAEEKISDKEYASCIEYLFNTKLLQM